MKILGIKKLRLNWLIGFIAAIYIGFSLADNTSKSDAGCNVDLTQPGQMSDIVSNVLMREFKKDETRVREFLVNARQKQLFQTGRELAVASALEFNIDEELFLAETIEYKDINCKSKHSKKQVVNVSEDESGCNVDLRNPGQMSDIVSNSLMLKYKKNESKVRAFLDNAYDQNLYATGRELASASAKEFGIPQEDFFDSIDEYKNVNCNTQGNYLIQPAQQLLPLSLTKVCDFDLSNPGIVSDIISNALIQEFNQDESMVNRFLNNANDQKQFSTGGQLIIASVKEFDILQADLLVAIEKHKNNYCLYQKNEKPKNGEVSVFAQNVLIHVVLHEMGHALLREFDLPTLSNEEALADAFATHYIVSKIPNKAHAILQARIKSLMIEANDVSRENWTVKGEHNSDARRAYQIAAISIAYDKQKYASLGSLVDMNESEINKASDYGSEVHRSWRRILSPLWMPDNQKSIEAKVDLDHSVFSGHLKTTNLEQLFNHILRSFDWHSQVTIMFKEGQGNASWSRSKRTITVFDEYIQRFNEQAKN